MSDIPRDRDWQDAYLAWCNGHKVDQNLDRDAEALFPNISTRALNAIRQLRWEDKTRVTIRDLVHGKVDSRGFYRALYVTRNCGPKTLDEINSELLKVAGRPLHKSHLEWCEPPAWRLEQ